MKKLMFKYRDVRRSGGDLHPLAQLYLYYYCWLEKETSPDNKYNKQWCIDYIRRWKIENKTYKNFV